MEQLWWAAITQPHTPPSHCLPSDRAGGGMTEVSEDCNDLRCFQLSLINDRKGLFFSLYARRFSHWVSKRSFIPRPGK